MAEKLFEKTHEQGVLTTMSVWVDRETGVNYIVCDNGQGVAITPRLNREGKPLITAREN